MARGLMPQAPPGQGAIRHAGLESTSREALFVCIMKYLMTLACFALALMATTAAPLQAQERVLPYWASLKYNEVRMRVGPSEDYPIEWVYKRQGLPVKVVRLREGWRLVEDADGAQGWIASSQLHTARGALVVGAGPTEVRAEPLAGAAVRWRAEPGVVALLLRCREAWCEVNLATVKQRKNGQNVRGWIERQRLWGTEDLPGDA